MIAGEWSNQVELKCQVWGPSGINSWHGIGIFMIFQHLLILTT